MGGKPAAIGPTLILALLGLPIAAFAGLYWRFFSPSQGQLARHLEPGEVPMVIDAPPEA